MSVTSFKKYVYSEKHYLANQQPLPLLASYFLVWIFKQWFKTLKCRNLRTNRSEHKIVAYSTVMVQQSEVLLNIFWVKCSLKLIFDSCTELNDWIRKGFIWTSSQTVFFSSQLKHILENTNSLSVFLQIAAFLDTATLQRTTF